MKKLTKWLDWLWCLRLEHFWWMDTTRRMALFAYILTLLSYALVSTPLSSLIATEYGDFWMGVLLTVSSILALPGYYLGGRLNNRWGCKATCRLILPIHATLILLFLLGKHWLPYVWAVFSFVNGITYIAIDGIFRQSIHEDSKAERIRPPSDEFKKIRFASAIAVASVLSYLIAGMAAPISFRISEVTYEGWVLSVTTLIFLAWGLIMRIQLQPHPAQLQEATQKKKAVTRKKERPSLRSRFQLFLIAVPFLGTAIVHTAFVTFLPRVVDPSLAGMVFMVAKFSNGIALLRAKSVVTHKSAASILRSVTWALVLGVSLIPIAQSLENSWIILLILLVSGILIGMSIGFSKLSIQVTLQNSAAENQKGAAMAPLAMISELGFVLTPAILGMVASLTGGYLAVWIITGLVPMIPLLLRTRKY